MREKLSSSGKDAAFEKVTFDNDASILFKHVTAKRFRFVYHYHPEIELIYFAEGDGLEFIGDSSLAFKAGHLVLLGSNLPHLWINDADCQYAEACVVQFKKEVLGDLLLLLPEFARIRQLMESAGRGVVFSKLITLEVVSLLTRLGSETSAKRLLTLLEILTVLSRDTQSCRLCATSSHVQHSAEDKRRIDKIYRYLGEHFREPCPVAQVAEAVAIAFKHYDSAKVIENRTMAEHLRFSVAHWHTFRNPLSDPFGVGTAIRNNRVLPSESNRATAAAGQIEFGFGASGS
jgi:hypothetical protein